ncbi:TPA: GtrA family protein, partial [Streptococcus suis]
NHDLTLVNAISTLFSQVLVIVLNYVLSKLFVFKDKK